VALFIRIVSAVEVSPPDALISDDERQGPRRVSPGCGR
jgi:hypothetical protein